jgi:hypothetical protein
MTNDETMSKNERRKIGGFNLRHSELNRHSTLDLRHS